VIPITQPELGAAEAKAARDVILSGWVTQGPRVQAFEQAFASAVGAPYACAVSSCTAALQLALLAVGVKPGDVVITVSHSFIATANAIRACFAEPIFVDIEKSSFGMDPLKLQQVLEIDCRRQDDQYFYRNAARLAHGESPLRFCLGQDSSVNNHLGRVAAVLPVHQMGFPCDIARIIDIAGEKKIPVVEDAACAIGSELHQDGGRQWDRIGRPHGDLACFSFHPRKVLTTGDGGMITTANKAMDAKIRLLRHHGMGVADTVRHSAADVIFERYLVTAFNFRMTDIQAAVGIEQLKRLNPMLRARRHAASVYAELLSDIPWLTICDEKQQIFPNWQSYPIWLGPEAPLSQHAFMTHLLKNGISSRRGIMNAHQEAPYSNYHWELPESERGRDSVVLLPMFSGITTRDLTYIAHVIRNAENSKETNASSP
jgi:perosamine synthetase